MIKITSRLIVSILFPPRPAGLIPGAQQTKRQIEPVSGVLRWVSPSTATAHPKEDVTCTIGPVQDRSYSLHRPRITISSQCKRPTATVSITRAFPKKAASCHAPPNPLGRDSGRLRGFHTPGHITLAAAHGRLRAPRCGLRAPAGNQTREKVRPDGPPISRRTASHILRGAGDPAGPRTSGFAIPGGGYDGL
jgi:hypothetical protein